MSKAANTIERGAEPIIRLVDVHKSFGRTEVLRGVHLDLARGRTTVVIGPSGVGKSVLLRHIVGLTRPDSGEVYFQSQRIDDLTEARLVSVRRQMGVLFQMGALFDSMSVEQNITFPLREHTKLTGAEQVERCAAVLSQVGLSDIAGSMPSELSGGQRKRVALARAIVLKPQVVLYDEPTTGLDPIRADLINELIRSLARRMGITSVVVTHDMASARKIADRIVMLYDCRIIADADPETFMGLENDVVQRFVHGRADSEDLRLIQEGLSSSDQGGGAL